MKKILFYIGIIILAVSCVSDATIGQFSDEVVAISSNIATRASKDKWASDDAIGVYMTNSTFDNLGTNSCYTTSTGDGLFSSTTPLLYPTSGTVDIFAYYPYFGDLSDASTYLVESKDQVDLLSASKSGVTPSSSAVEMIFDHLLSKVSLTIEANGGLSDSDLEGLVVYISKVSTTAKFTPSTNSLGELSEAADFTFETLSDGTSSSAILIPQDLSGVKLYFVTKDYDSFSATISLEKFEKGTDYQYDVSICRTGVSITKSSISDWNEETDDAVADIVDIELKSDGKYYINSAVGFAAFRDLVNGLSNTQSAIFAGFESSAFGVSTPEIHGVLTRDIDLGDICGEHIGTDGTSWIPIGSIGQVESKWVESPYSGIFDGGGYKISSLYISTKSNQQGLFRYIGEGGVVCNLGVSGSVIYESTTNYEGQIGGIAAYNEGTIINCYSLVEVKGEYMCNVGGIAAYSSGSIVNCYNHCDIIGLVNVGGIAGKIDGSGGYVGYCYNTGEISSSVSNAVNGDTTVTIEPSTSTEPFVVKYGGVVGYNHSTHDEPVKGSFCLNNTIVSIGQVGVTASSGALSTNVCYAEYLTSATFATTMNNGAATYNTNYKPTSTYTTACAWNFNTYAYPTHDFGKTPTYTILDIIYNSVNYTINTNKGLLAFAALVNGDGDSVLPEGLVTSSNTTSSSNDIYFQFGTAHPDISGKLTANIDLGGVSWTPIGNYQAGSSLVYSGTFDGGGYTISGLNINSTYGKQGFFGYLDTKGVINNVTVEGTVYCSNDTGATYEVGGIASYNAGLIINCINKVNVSGNINVGGLAGYSTGVVMNSCNHGEINGLSTSATDTSGDAIVGEKNVGGLVGQSASGSYHYNSYNTGSVKGETTSASNIGGLVGYFVPGSAMSSCYYLITSADSYLGNSTGTGGNKTDDYMKSEEFVDDLNGYSYIKTEYQDVYVYSWMSSGGSYPVISQDKD